MLEVTITTKIYQLLFSNAVVIKTYGDTLVASKVFKKFLLIFIITCHGDIHWIPAPSADAHCGGYFNVQYVSIPSVQAYKQA